MVTLRSCSPDTLRRAVHILSYTVLILWLYYTSYIRIQRRGRVYRRYPVPRTIL